MSRKSTSTPSGNVWIGTHHAPGEEHARREGERERAEKDEPGAWERSIERRIDSSTGVSTNTSQPSGAQARGLTSFTILRRAKTIDRGTTTNMGYPHPVPDWRVE